MPEGSALFDLVQCRQKFVNEGQRKTTQYECAWADGLFAARQVGIWSIGKKIERHGAIFSRTGLPAAASATKRPKVCIAFSACASQACP